MQKIYLPGEKKKAVCPTCEGLVSATFQYGTYQHPDGTSVPHVLMLYCDECNHQLAHAHQSSYLIQKARRSHRLQRTSVRVPQALIDMASSQVHSLGGDPKSLSALDLVIKATVATGRRGEARISSLGMDPTYFHDGKTVFLRWAWSP